MKTKILDSIMQTEDGRQMADILHTCVHCGLCNATCPTYQVKGDELDGPRGRIYLIKAMLEGESVSKKTQLHLDRCLTCRSCETTCPSGVKYGHLVELARPRVDQQVKRGLSERLRRAMIRQIVPYPQRFGLLLRLGRLFKPFLPRALSELVPQISPEIWPAKPRSYHQHERKMLILEGCAQAAVAPRINQAARNIFDRFEITLQSPKGVGCCGAVSYHLGDEVEARAAAKNNIDRWWPSIESGAEALLVTSSGCAAMIQDYPYLFRDDATYRVRAEKLVKFVCDPSEKLDPAELKKKYRGELKPKQIAFQAPCSMQHSTHTHEHVKRCLRALEFELCAVADEHLCCGSAGSYSLLQPDLSNELLDRKLESLGANKPEMIVSANIGCMMHLARRAEQPVRHWLELIDGES